MNHYKKFIFYLLTTILISCNPKNDTSKNSAEANKENITSKQPNKEVVKEENHDSVVKAIDAIIKKQEEERERNWQSVFPKGTWQSYPHIIRSIFSENSTKEEVISIMGTPEYVDKSYNENRNLIETWFYGKIEIGFNIRGYLRAGRNLDKCNKYVVLSSLIMSSDEYERRLGLELSSRY